MLALTESHEAADDCIARHQVCPEGAVSEVYSAQKGAEKSPHSLVSLAQTSCRM